MNTIKIIVKGYSKEVNGGWIASSNTTLIKVGKINIIVDPGINKKLLLKSLANEGLGSRDINYVYLTHYHPDHILLAALFEKAKIFDSETIYEKDKETSYGEFLPNTDIKVIKTPGHANEHSSLVVEIKDKGTVVVAGDVFWWTYGEKQNTDEQTLLEKNDPFVIDNKALRKSRKTVLDAADWIIPGHGKMFKNPRKSAS